MAKVWFITGISSGLGQALATALLNSGHKVAGTFRKPEQAADFSLSHAENALGLVLDVTDAAQIKEAVQQTVKDFGTIDVLVNNAGFGLIGGIEEITMEEAREQMETNFFGALAVTKEILPIMRLNKSGRILQVSSVAGFRASAGFGLYNASKFALEGFSEALALEVAPFNIVVTIVEPGPFRTQFAGSSVRLPKNKLEEYKGTPVAGMYHYIDRANGQQEGDPAKAAQAIINYVEEGRKELRLPLGKTAVDAIKLKLATVQKEVAANEAIALSTHFDK
jgi:NAD(P)-dependent dehydrogenase (short-subunit alcohol dehydrogenase family)